MKDLRSILVMMGAMLSAGGGQTTQRIEPSDINTTPKTPPIPKGCKRYFYDKDGIETSEMNSVLYVDALTKEKADKKAKKRLFLI